MIKSDRGCFSIIVYIKFKMIFYVSIHELLTSVSDDYLGDYTGVARQKILRRAHDSKSNSTHTLHDSWGLFYQ